MSMFSTKNVIMSVGFPVMKSRQPFCIKRAADEGYTDMGPGPEDAATIAVFLASDEAGKMTGQNINSGGGVMW